MALVSEPPRPHGAAPAEARAAVPATSRRPGPGARRAALRAAVGENPLRTDAALAELLGCSVQTVRLDRGVLGIPDVRARAHDMAVGHLRGPGARLRGEVVELRPGVRALAVLELAGDLGPGAQDPALFADAEALALAASGIESGTVEVVNVKFARPAAVGARLGAVAEVLRGRGSGTALRRVVLVQIRSGERTVLRAKFVVGTEREGGWPGASGSRPAAGGD